MSYIIKILFFLVVLGVSNAAQSAEILMKCGENRYKWVDNKIDGPRIYMKPFLLTNPSLGWEAYCSGDDVKLTLKDRSARCVEHYGPPVNGYNIYVLDFEFGVRTQLISGMGMPADKREIKCELK